MSVLELFNACEAGLWFCLSAVCLLKSRTAPPDLRKGYLALACWLVLFGISDIIEVSTGSWWQPWWLLLLKGTCLVGLIYNAWNLWRGGSAQVAHLPPEGKPSSSTTSE